MTKPILIPVLNDDETISHWALINPENGEKLWSENPEECAAQGYKVKSSPAPALTEEIDDQKLYDLFASIPIGNKWTQLSNDVILACCKIAKHYSISNSREPINERGIIRHTSNEIQKAVFDCQMLTTRLGGSREAVLKIIQKVTEELINSREGKDGEGWIRLRNPEPEEQVLFLTDLGYVSRGFLSEQRIWTETFTGCLFYNVIGWQPLPPAPKTQKP